MAHGTVRPRNGGATDTAAVVAGRAIAIPGSARGCVFHTDLAARVTVTGVATPPAIADTAYGYIAAGTQGGWDFQQGVDKYIHWSPQTAVATTVRVMFY